jgi:hypothetical protein
MLIVVDKMANSLSGDLSGDLVVHPCTVRVAIVRCSGIAHRTLRRGDLLQLTDGDLVGDGPAVLVWELDPRQDTVWDSVGGLCLGVRDDFLD